MKLTAEQTARLERDGSLSIAGLSTPDGARVLSRAAGKVYASDRKQVRREGFGAAGTAFAPAEDGGGCAPTGPPSLRPFGRSAVSLSLCRVDSRIRRFQHEQGPADCDFSPPEPLTDDGSQEPVESSGVRVAP